MSLKNDTIVEVIKYCNKNIVPESTYDESKMFHSEWFEQYFSFLNNKKVEKHLGEAFYQARFQYKLMSALRLTKNKQKGIIKFQIIQYASICEALLDTAITKYFKTEAENHFSTTEFSICSNTLSKDAKITFGGNERVICKTKTKKGDIKRTRADLKADFAASKGIISKGVCNQYSQLYSTRNNVHILKAAESDYNPKLNESLEAFQLIRKFTSEVKDFYEKNII